MDDPWKNKALYLFHSVSWILPAYAWNSFDCFRLFQEVNATLAHWIHWRQLHVTDHYPHHNQVLIKGSCRILPDSNSEKPLHDPSP